MRWPFRVTFNCLAGQVTEWKSFHAHFTPSTNRISFNRLKPYSLIRINSWLIHSELNTDLEAILNSSLLVLTIFSGYSLVHTWNKTWGLGCGSIFRLPSSTFPWDKFCNLALWHNSRIDAHTQGVYRINDLDFHDFFMPPKKIFMTVIPIRNFSYRINADVKYLVETSFVFWIPPSCYDVHLAFLCNFAISSNDTAK